MAKVFAKSIMREEVQEVVRNISFLEAVRYVKEKSELPVFTAMAIVEGDNIVGYYNKLQGFILLKYGTPWLKSCLDRGKLYFRPKKIQSVVFTGTQSAFSDEAEAFGAGFKLHEVKPQFYKKQSKNHYENKNGVDLMEYLEKEVFTPSELKVIAKFNMIKYAARAGLKEGEPAEKDMKKAQDYKELYIENDKSFEGRFISQDVASIVSDFKVYK